MKSEIIRIFAILLLIGAISGLIIGLQLYASPEYDAFLNIAFIGTADKSDCAVIWQKDFAMMVDAAEDRDAEAILSFLAEKNIGGIDYLILTHPDKDHIGSASAITGALKVKTVIQPFYQKEYEAYRNLQARFAQDKVKTVVPSRALRYVINDLEVYIYPPMEKNYSSNNNYSLAVYARHGNVGILIPGDADNKRIAELTQIEWGPVDLYKLPRHGIDGENSIEFYSRLAPRYSVVTARHAGELTAKAGAGWGTEWFFTVGATAEFLSDGETLTPIRQAADER